jgi:ferric-dicitrate binding protein FerR (iron transport regulator)
MAGKDPLILADLCDRAREWVSLRLDGELSPLEEELLDRHLELCDECHAFAQDVRWATDVLRLTPQERPARRLTVRPRPTPRVSTRRVTAMAAAAALALGALLGAVVDSPSSGVQSEVPSEISFLTNQQDADEFRQLPRTRILSPVPVPSAPPNTPEGVI